MYQRMQTILQQSCDAPLKSAALVIEVSEIKGWSCFDKRNGSILIPSKWGNALHWYQALKTLAASREMSHLPQYIPGYSPSGFLTWIRFFQRGALTYAARHTKQLKIRTCERSDFGLIGGEGGESNVVQLAAYAPHESTQKAAWLLASGHQSVKIRMESLALFSVASWYHSNHLFTAI